MKINFVSSGFMELASFRYHVFVPKKVLQRMGDIASISRDPLLNYDIYISSKHINEQEQDMALDLKAKGKKTVFHCCDNHFATEKEKHYRTMISRVDEIITTTKTLQDAIKQETGSDSILIPDMVEWPEEKPYFNRTGRLKLLWYGHSTNIMGLVKVAPYLNKYRMKICTKMPEEHPT